MLTWHSAGVWCNNIQWSPSCFYPLVMYWCPWSRFSPENTDLLTTLGLLYLQVGYTVNWCKKTTTNDALCMIIHNFKKNHIYNNMCLQSLFNHCLYFLPSLENTKKLLNTLETLWPTTQTTIQYALYFIVLHSFVFAIHCIQPQAHWSPWRSPVVKCVFNQMVFPPQGRFLLLKHCSFPGHPCSRKHDADPRGLRCGHEQVPRGRLRRTREPAPLEQHWHVLLRQEEIRGCEWCFPNWVFIILVHVFWKRGCFSLQNVSGKQSSFNESLSMMLEASQYFPETLSCCAYSNFDFTNILWIILSRWNVWIIVGPV